nr:actin cytoskeleton-regulatory complex protein pan-1-like [Lolium perenne]
MSVPCSDQEFRPVKAKAASLPPGVTAERCWCGRLAKVKQVEDFSDQFGMKFFMCASYEHVPPRSSASSSTRPPSPPPLCKWFHWIDTEQPDWARQEVEEKHRRAWATFFEEERREKVRANEKAERERQIQKLRAEQARNREVNQKRMDDEAARRFAEEDVRKEAREAERKRLRERAAEAQVAEERGDKSGKWPRWTQGK